MLVFGDGSWWYGTWYDLFLVHIFLSFAIGHIILNLTQRVQLVHPWICHRLPNLSILLGHASPQPIDRFSRLWWAQITWHHHLQMVTIIKRVNKVDCFGCIPFFLNNLYVLPKLLLGHKYFLVGISLPVSSVEHSSLRLPQLLKHLFISSWHLTSRIWWLLSNKLLFQRLCGHLSIFKRLWHREILIRSLSCMQALVNWNRMTIVLNLYMILAAYLHLVLPFNNFWHQINWILSPKIWIFFLLLNNCPNILKTIFINLKNPELALEYRSHREEPTIATPCLASCNAPLIHCGFKLASAELENSQLCLS